MSKNIKGAAVNALQYTGVVKLSQYIGGKKRMVAKVHNAGGKALFNFLVDCLIGDFDIAKLDRPTKIMLLVEDEDKSLSRANDTGFINILAKPEKVYSIDKGVVRFSFMIPQDIFNGSNFNAIGLYPNSATASDVDSYAALCKVDSRELNNISVSSVLILDWELYIANSDGKV